MTCNCKLYTYLFPWAQAKPQMVVSLWWRDVGREKIVTRISEYLTLMNGFGEQGGSQKAWYKRLENRWKIQKKLHLQETREVAGEPSAIIPLMQSWSLSMFCHMIHIWLAIRLFTLQGAWSTLVLQVPLCSQCLSLTLVQSFYHFLHLK